jgi:hypothetical protein
MQCPFCKSELNSGASVCASCGATETKKDLGPLGGLFGLIAGLVDIGAALYFPFSGFQIGPALFVLIVNLIFIAVAYGTTRDKVWKRRIG